MIVVSHPTGNAFVRALLEGLEREGRLGRFFTTLSTRRRRSYPIPSEKIETSPVREMTRLMMGRFGTPITRHETGWASVDGVYRALDRRVAEWVKNDGRGIEWVYGYEDGALATFRAAAAKGMRRAYELPIAYWETTRRLLREEAERLPEWEPTLGATRDSDEKMARKTEELDLAEKVICPSEFVVESVPERARGKCVVAVFGTPRFNHEGTQRTQKRDGKLRVLFAGAMTQRKGLADLFEAMKILGRGDVELVVMGAAISTMEFYRKQFEGFAYEGPRGRDEVLELMETCDLLILPSIVEGRALVQQEAMSCGLPVIATRNAGGADLIEEGRTGFLVPIRAPGEIAARIGRLADDRGLLEMMSTEARRVASARTWEDYAKTISAALPS